MSEYVVGGIVNTACGALMAYLAYRGWRGNSYINKTTDELIRHHLVAGDRERLVKRFRRMLLFGVGFSLLFMALGVATLVAGLRG